MNLHEVDVRRHSAITSPKLAVIATCCDQEGNPNAITLGWHMPLSSIPPLYGIAIAPARHSHDLIEKTGEFVINVMGKEHAAAAEICGSASGRVTEKLGLAGLRTIPSKEVHPPAIDGALGVLECRVIDSLVTGDHTMFVGEVLRAGVVVENLMRQREDFSTRTLLYFSMDAYGHGVILEDRS